MPKTMRITPRTTHQQVFDYVVAHLREQGCQSMDEDEVPLYRGPNKTMCAVGCVIPDYIYRSKMERMCVGTLLEHWPVLKPRLGPFTMLLARLQKIHDGFNPGGWEEDFKALAWDLDLSYTPPS